ncbi:MAG: tetratricopeptide repeat protein, partial [Candidatus Neomarinimicrobiota bacterium]
DQAEQCYRLALEHDSKGWYWAYYRGLIRTELGDVEGAVGQLQQVLKLNPNINQAKYYLGSALFKLNRFDEAKAILAGVHTGNPTVLPLITEQHTPMTGAFGYSVHARFDIARIELQMGDTTKAERSLDNLVREQVDFGPAYRLLSKIYAATGRTSLSIATEIRASDFDTYLPPVDPLYDNLLLYSRDQGALLKNAEIALQLRNLAWAETLLNLALNLDPSDANAIYILIAILLEERRVDEVTPILDAYVTSHQDNATRLRSMAKLLQNSGLLQRAAGLYQKALMVTPNDATLGIDLIKTLTQGRQYKSAQKLCDYAIRKFPNDSRFRTEMGRIFYAQNNLDAAKQQFQRAIGMNPTDVVNLMMLATIAERAGNFQEAVAHVKTASETSPTHQAVRIKYANMLMSQSNWDEALAVLMTGLTAEPNNLDFIERVSWLLSTSPDKSVRDGKEALALAGRLIAVRKSPLQELSCSIALAAAHGEAGNFSKAIDILERLKERARNTGVNFDIKRVDNYILEFNAQRPIRQ